MFGKQYGKVFIGVQPTFGYEGDPMRLLFSRSASPHHGFAAYYTYLEKIFKARARPRACLQWQTCMAHSAPSNDLAHANIARKFAGSSPERAEYDALKALSRSGESSALYEL